MSLKHRVALMLACWILVILLLGNIFIYYLVIQIVTKSEIELLNNEANSLLNKGLLEHPEIWNDPGQWKDFLIPREMIRLIGPDSSVLYQIYSDEELLQKPPHYETRRRTEIKHTRSGFYVYVLVPAYVKDHQAAVLEIGRNLKPFNDYLKVLLTVLLFTSLGAVILSLGGGYFYTEVLLKPLHRLIHTMQNIEQSGGFRRLQLDGAPRGDELTHLMRTFNRMMDRLEEMFERQNQFLADASHELRTPLTIIESYASLLRRWASSDEAIRQEALEAIQSEASRLKEMTNQLLVLMHTEDDVSILKAIFPLAPIVESASVSMQLAFHRSIHVHYRKEETFLVKGDPEKIRQLLIILIDNAIKYSKEPIHIYVEKVTGGIELRVVDFGIGIAESDLPHLFDRLYRADKARSRKKGGMGLGLAIAKNIVRQHDGFIEIQSRFGQGTTVIVTLPRP